MKFVPRKFFVCFFFFTKLKCVKFWLELGLHNPNLCVFWYGTFQLFTLVKSTTDVKIPLKTNSLSIPLYTPAEMCLYPLSAQQHATPKQADLGLFMNLWFRSLTVGLKGPMATLLEKGSFINNYCMMLVNPTLVEAVHASTLDIA